MGDQEGPWPRRTYVLPLHETDDRLDVGLLDLGSDEDVHSLSCLICNFKVVEVFIEHEITKLNCYYMSNFEIRATIEEYHKDIGVESSSVSPKKNELLMLEWYDNRTSAKASSNTRSVTRKSIPRGLFIYACDETMISYTQLSGVNSCVTETTCLELDEELGNENEADDVNHASVNEDNHDGNTTTVDEHLDNDNTPLENAASIGEDIQNHDFEYDADSSEDEEANNYADVMIDEEKELHEAEVEVHLFGLRESDYPFTNIVVSSELPANVFMKNDGYEMDIDDFDTDSGGEGDCPGGRISALV
nr:hypothetical protein [Tanacetum cinerariifolium]